MLAGVAPARAGRGGHAGCALLGGAIGVLFAPPRVARGPTSLAAGLGTVLALLALPDRVAGPLAVAHQLQRAPAGTVDGAEVGAALSCLALAAAALALARWWLRRAG